MNVKATFRNVELTSMTPYSAKFAGYRIASGKLDADLEYFIQQRQLKGDNKIIIDQLTLGERVESPTATKLPLELAIALLKDADGKIDLGLPVSGSLDDPQFSIGGLVWKVLVNVLTKIVTAPFRALGALLGVESSQLEGISFDPGSDALLPPEKAKLGQVATALDKRPQLKVGIRPVYATQDADAIRSVRIRRELATRAGFKLKEGEDPGPLDASDPKNQKLIQSLFVERFGKDELGRVTESVEKAQAGDGKAPDKEAKEQIRTQVAETLLTKLNESEQVSDEELKALAQRRADAVKAEFATQGKLAMDRVAIEPVEKVESADNKMVESKFALVPQ
jgi:outer membrane protein OmpA-like peptidoglycan-associated protein